MNIAMMSTFCFAFTSLLLGFMIYEKRKDDLARLWFAYNIVIATWAVAFSFQINNAISYEKALWISRFADAVAIFIPIAWLRFVCAFLNKKNNKKVLIGLYGIAIGLALTTPTSLFIPSLKDKSNIGFQHFAQGGPSFHIFSIFFFTLVGWGFYLLLRECVKSDLGEERKKQLRFFLLANSLGFAGGSSYFLPVYDIDWPINFFSILMPFFPFLTALAFTRYRLLDIDEIAHTLQREKLAAIGTLATSVNHEIRNPLYVIQGLADSYLVNLSEGIYKTQDETIQKSKETLSKTAEQATRAIDIMKRFAVFAKQAADEKPTVEKIDLNDTVENILPLVRHELELDKIHFLKNIPQSCSELKADRRHLEQILFNLIVNACQAMKEGGEIELSAEQQNGHIRICVKDTGPGIEPNQLKQIFEPFYTTKEEGTGLGLYITKQLVERNGGRISVNSRPGHGTRFMLDFSVK